MNTKLYVGNLADDTSARDLINLFSAYGNVVDVNITVDRNHQKPHGIGLVTMVTPEGARAAIQALDGKQVSAHILTVAICNSPKAGKVN